MGDTAPRDNTLATGAGTLPRRRLLRYGGGLAATALAAPMLARPGVSARAARPAAQATPAGGLALSAEAQAFYTPVAGFDGKRLQVVINAGFFSREDSKQVFESRRDQFNEATGAEVEYIPLPENQMYDQVRLELATNSGKYDAMTTGAGGAKDYGLSGFLLPLPTPPDVADFYEGDVAQYSIGGELYGMPMFADTNLIYWRSDLFEAVGLDPARPPETYDEFRDYAIRLTTDTSGRHPGEDGFDADSIDIFGSAYKGTAGLACTWEWYNYLYAFGGDLLDADYNPTLNSPEAVASLTWVVDNFRTHKIYPPDITSYDYTEFHTLFAQGRVAMAINWPYMWNIVQDPAQSTVVDKVRVGRKPGQVTHGGNIGGWSLNVFKMSPNPDLAIAFAKWMAAPEASLAYAQVQQGNPVRHSVSAVMQDTDPQLYGAIGENLADGRGVKWLDTGPSWMEIEKIQYEAIQRALIGDADPQAALDDANEAARGILEKNRFYEDLLPQLQG